MMALFAQLTDLHIRAGGALAYGQVDTLSHLRAAVDHLNALQPQPDAVLISGDLVDLGEADEYAVLRPELDRLTAPYLIIPGNHDGPAFWECFADHLTGAVPAVGHTATVAGQKLVLLDTSVPGASGGALTDARATWLQTALAGEGAPLLVMHHPPFETGIGHMDKIGFEGTGRLADLVAAYPPCAILCGHIHRTIFATLGSVPVIVGPSPAHAVSLDLSPGAASTFHMEPPGILLHTVTGEGVRTHLSFIGAFAGPFPFFSD